MCGRERLIRTSDTVCEAGNGPRLRMTALVFVLHDAEWSATAIRDAAGEVMC